MRAGTFTPSLAGIHTISGTSHLCESHCAVGLVVSCVSAAPAANFITYISGGLFANE